jgi:hypothetical protein
MDSAGDLRHLQMPTTPATPPGASPAPLVIRQLLTTGGNRSVLRKTIIKLGGGRENGGNYLLRAVIGVVEMPKAERYPTRWEIVRACTFCMTAAL